MNLGPAIRSIRKDKGFTQAELARGSGITQTYLSLLESGSKEPSLTTLRAICKVLQMPIPFILFKALSDEDIVEERREHFRSLKPKIESIIDDYSAI